MKNTFATMAANKRNDLLSSVSKKELASLILITKKLANEDALVDTLLELNKGQLEELWDGSSQICMSTLLNCNSDDTNLANLNELCELLHSIVILATATLKSLLKTNVDKNDYTDLKVPHSLFDTAVIIHGILPTLPSDRNNLKDHISRLFETWWISGFSGRLELMENTVFYLLAKSTQEKSTQADVNRVKAIQKAFMSIDLSTENVGALCPLLLQCTYHHQYVTSPMGMKFLAFLFTLDADFMEKMHMSIKNHLLSVPKPWLIKYGEIYFRAWQTTTGELREHFEQKCIQDLMFRAVHANRSQRSQLFNSLFKILRYFHKEKTQKGVEGMLARLYEPILWRSLNVANSDVRVNAATIMFDVFPLFDQSLLNEQSDVMLQKQFDMMQNLLSDPVPEVRLIAVKGIGQVINLYWELIPTQVIQFFVTSLVQDHIYDVTSPSIREAVLKVMHQLCDNHLAITLLKTVLPELRNFVHDVSEKVRIAMFDLLLKVKGLRAIKFYHVVPVEHILSRLEIDSAPVCELIMKLIYHSFVPMEQEPAELVKRCITLIKTNAGAARQFFTHLPNYLSLEDTVKYIIFLCRYLLHLVELIPPDSSSMSSDTQNESANYSLEHQSSSRSKKPKTSNRTKQLRKSDNNAQTQEADINPGEGLNLNEDDQDTDSIASMSGMVEAIYLMLTVALVKLSLPENKQMKEGLDKKLSVTVRKLMAVSSVSEMDNALIAIAGHLPGKVVPLIVQNVFKRLKQICRKTTASDITIIIKSLVLWGKTESLIELVKDSLGNELLHKSLLTSEPVQSRLPKPTKKKTVGFTAEKEADITLLSAVDIIVKMITLAECRVVLLNKHKKNIASLLETLDPVVQLLRDFFQTDLENSNSSVDVKLWTQIFTVYLRLTAFVCLPNGQKTDDNGDDNMAARHLTAVGNILNWTVHGVVPHLNSHNKLKQEVSNEITVLVLKISYSLLMVNIFNETFLDNLFQLCQAVFDGHLQCLSVCFQALVCLLQLTQLRKPKTDLPDNNSRTISAFDNNIYACSKSFFNSYIMCVASTERRNENLDEDNTDFLAKLSPVLADIVHELTRPGRSLEMAERVLGSFLLCAIEETKFYCQKNGFSKDSILPPLSTMFMNFIAKRTSLRCLLIRQLEKSIDSDELPDIYHLCSLVAIMVRMKSVSANGLESVLKSILTLVNSRHVEQDIERQLKKQLEETVQQWMIA
ncbi:hypothetical protein Btru_007928 [Bulinus truncatus]|nr:hypothetical protein Btru_007928 [Bulinus truncatus]